MATNDEVISPEAIARFRERQATVRLAALQNPEALVDAHYSLRVTA
jgi:hypothetical protein